MAIEFLINDTTTGGYDYLATVTGTGAVVMGTSPTLVTLVLGVATATSINKVAITTPATSATLTIADGKTATISNTLVFAGTDGSTITLGTGGTVAYTGGTLAQFAATTSAQLAGVLTDENGTGAFVGTTNAVLVTPTLGAASATSINGLTISASSGTLALANGSTLAIIGAFSVTLTATAGTTVTFPTTGTLSTLTGAETLTNKILTSPILTTPTTSTITLSANILCSDAGSPHIFYSADGTGATTSLNMTFKTGTTVSANSGATAVASGAVSTIGNSGTVGVYSGNSTTAGNSGAASLYTGTALTGTTGNASFYTGSSTTGTTGHGLIYTGNVNLGDTGYLTLTTGNAVTGSSGNIVFTTGTASTTKGSVISRGTLLRSYSAPTPYTTTASATPIAVADMRAGWITANQGAAGAAVYTTATGVLLDGEFNSLSAGDSFEFTIINISVVAAEDVTLVGGVGVTIYGSDAVQSNDAATSKSTGTWRFVKTGVGTFDGYRI